MVYTNNGNGGIGKTSSISSIDTSLGVFALPVVGKNCFEIRPRERERPSLAANILKPGKGGFSTFAGVFDPGNGRIGHALKKKNAASYSARGTQRRLPFQQNSSLKSCRYTPISSINQFRTRSHV